MHTVSISFHTPCVIYCTFIEDQYKECANRIEIDPIYKRGLEKGKATIVERGSKEINSRSLTHFRSIARYFPIPPKTLIQHSINGMGMENRFVVFYKKAKRRKLPRRGSNDPKRTKLKSCSIHFAYCGRNLGERFHIKSSRLIEQASYLNYFFLVKLKNRIIILITTAAYVMCVGAKDMKTRPTVQCITHS